MLTPSMCLPGAAFKLHGVEQEMAELPSRVAVAPPGLVITITDCKAALRTALPGSAAEGLGTLAGARVAGLPPSGGPTGLGFASSGEGAAAAVGEGAATGVRNGGCGSAGEGT